MESVNARKGMRRAALTAGRGGKGCRVLAKTRGGTSRTGEPIAENGRCEIPLVGERAG